MQKDKFNISFIMEDLFYPQTNFYFMNMDKVDYINDMNFLEESFNNDCNISIASKIKIYIYKILILYIYIKLNELLSTFYK